MPLAGSALFAIRCYRHPAVDRVRPKCESESKELRPMGDLGKYWAGAPAISANPLTNNPESGVFHRIDIAGVASSIFATPTMKGPVIPMDDGAFLCLNERRTSRRGDAAPSLIGRGEHAQTSSGCGRAMTARTSRVRQNVHGLSVIIDLRPAKAIALRYQHGATRPTPTAAGCGPDRSTSTARPAACRWARTIGSTVAFVASPGDFSAGRS